MLCAEPPAAEERLANVSTALVAPAELALDGQRSEPGGAGPATILGQRWRFRAAARYSSVPDLMMDLPYLCSFERVREIPHWH